MGLAELLNDGNRLLTSGKVDDAIALFKSELARSSQPELFHALGLACVQKLDFGGALDNLLRAVELDSTKKPFVDSTCRILEILPPTGSVVDYLRRLARACRENPAFLKLIERTALYMEKQRELSNEDRVRQASESLHAVGRNHGTDKSEGTDGHTYAGLSYMDVYEPYLKPLRNRAVNFLEIGVLGGCSLRAWREYFPQGKIFGLDINPEAKRHEGDRISITIGSQSDLAVLGKVAGQVDAYDVVLDDGSHATEHMEVSFKHLWPTVKPGGIYILEDLGCTHRGVDMEWPGMKYNKEKSLECNRSEFEAFFLKLISDVDHERGDVLSVHFWHYIMVVLKKPRTTLL